MIQRSLLLSFLMLSLFLFSCKDEDEPKLNMKKTAFSGSLRTHGYYYHDFESDVSRKLIYILYRDGVVLYGGAPANADLTARETEFSDGVWDITAKPEKTFWGLFKVSGSTITFNQWYIRDGGILGQYTTTGNILNDSTFLMTSTDRNGTSGEVIDETYHFKSASKPDSTNQFLNEN